MLHTVSAVAFQLNSHDKFSFLSFSIIFFVGLSMSSERMTTRGSKKFKRKEGSGSKNLERKEGGAQRASED